MRQGFEGGGGGERIIYSKLGLRYLITCERCIIHLGTNCDVLVCLCMPVCVQYVNLRVCACVGARVFSNEQFVLLGRKDQCRGEEELGVKRVMV